MPVRVTGIGHGTVCLGRQISLFTILVYQGSAVLTTNLHIKGVGISTIGHMTVHTLTWHHTFGQNSRLIETMYVTLIDTNVAPHLITRCDTAISYAIFIKTIFADNHFKVLILQPLTALLHTDRKRQFATGVLFCQFMPVVHIKISPVAVGMQFTTLRPFHHDIHTVDILFCKIKIHGSNIRRNRYPDVVGINSRQLIHQGRVGGTFTARRACHC